MPTDEIQQIFETKCCKGLHPLKLILEHRVEYNVDYVVRWCPICGTIVVDEDNLSCIIPGKVMSMTRPKILEQQNPV